MSMHVLIAGCGDIGLALSARLLAAGCRVSGLRRCWPETPPGLQPIVADLTKPWSLKCLPKGVDQLVYCPAPGERSEQAYRAVYLQGLNHLLAAMDSALQRLLFVSSTAVYGQDDGTWVDEQSPTKPRRFNGQVLLEAEHAARRSGLSTTVLRLAGIYGPGRRRLVDQVLAGASCRDQAYTNRIHRDDAAGAIAHLLQQKSPADCYIGVDHEPAVQCQVMSWLAAKLEAPPPTVEPTTGPSNKRCRNDRLLSSGFEFQYPHFRAGYSALL